MDKLQINLARVLIRIYLKMICLMEKPLVVLQESGGWNKWSHRENDDIRDRVTYRSFQWSCIDYAAPLITPTSLLVVHCFKNDKNTALVAMDPFWVNKYNGSSDEGATRFLYIPSFIFFNLIDPNLSTIAISEKKGSDSKKTFSIPFRKTIVTAYISRESVLFEIN